MSSPSRNRRADDMSAEEVKEFWHGFCERKGIDAATRARGDEKIERDPDYWADQTMTRLLDSVSSLFFRPLARRRVISRRGWLKRRRLAGPPGPRRAALPRRTA